jgi:hypothetical protein
MVIRHAYKITKQLYNSHKLIQSELQLNKMVTFLHIAVIVGSTIPAFLEYQVRASSTSTNRIYTSLITFTGLQDIFLAYIMFFILDEDKGVNIIRDEAKKITYPVLEVAKVEKPRLSTIIENEDE